MNAQALIKPELFLFNAEQLKALLPMLTVFGGGSLAILVAAIRKEWFTRWVVFGICFVTLIAAAVLEWDMVGQAALALFGGMWTSDAMGHYLNLIFYIVGALTILTSIKYLDREGLQYPEYNILTVFSVMGMQVMASALDLVVVFIALELMSISVYVLVGFRRADRRSNEAAVKYFILGSAASAILLYGAALLYGATGSVQLPQIQTWSAAHAGAQGAVYWMGTWLVILGLLFKVAAVPFHMWMPDVYEGAPTPITGFMTTALKAAAFGTFLRVIMAVGTREELIVLLSILTVATMVIGNLVALTQSNLKRMLAYSSISHTGYLLLGVLSGGYSSVLIYLVVYAAMNFGAFLVLTLLSERGDAGLNLHDLSGLARRRPALAFSLAVFLFAMAGIPPTAGFAAKYILFYGAVQAGHLWLVVIAVLCSAISVYYYLRVLVYVYMREPSGGTVVVRRQFWPAAVAALMVVLTLALGIVPSQIVQAARQAVETR